MKIKQKFVPFFNSILKITKFFLSKMEQQNNATKKKNENTINA